MSLELNPAESLPPEPSMPTSTPVFLPSPAPDVVASEFTEFDDADDDLEDFDDDFDDEFEEEMEDEYDFGENADFDESHFAKPIGNNDDEEFDGEDDEEEKDDGEEADDEEEEEES